MRILMLGWEFPPFMTGGLGTACYGLTKALVRQGSQVIFILPRPVESGLASHVRMLSPKTWWEAQEKGAGKTAISGPKGHGVKTTEISRAQAHGGETGEIPGPEALDAAQARGLGVSTGERPLFKVTPQWLRSPYQSVGGRFVPAEVVGGTGSEALGVMGGAEPEGPEARIGFVGLAPRVPGVSWVPGVGAGISDVYGGDLLQETQRYARLCVALAAGERFDVIHAHDWVTFPAALAVAAASGKPMVAHVHSTEFDRSGQNVNPPVYELERRGMHGAIRVIAVSHLTRSIVIHRYGVDGGKVDVVYNGIDSDPDSRGDRALETAGRTPIRRGDKIVLFLGRITWQKGPEFFIRAAKKVLEKYDRVKFVMAGAGDKVTDVIELAAAYGIGHRVAFTGFLSGPDVERIFQMADLYVMPSVSEPFGIAPLEAIRHDVPVIISKTSGVAEVLTNVLKVDFWDVEEMANKIIAVLKHPPLSNTLRAQADIEARRLTWDDAAAHCLDVYLKAAQVMG